MEKIYIGFSHHPSSLLSKAIQFAEGTNYSHVYIRRVSRYGEYVYQASGLTVNFTNIDTFKSKSITVEEYEFELSDIQKNKLLAFSIKYCGRSYNVKQLFQIAALMIGKKIGIKFHFKGDGDNTFICSELGALFCKDILEMDIPEDEDFMTPAALHPYVAKNGKKVIL